MDMIETVAYRKAFNQYLRKGTPIGLSLKTIVTHTRIGDSSDVFGAPYRIHDRWQTKFNATVKTP